MSGGRVVMRIGMMTENQTIFVFLNICTRSEEEAVSELNNICSSILEPGLGSKQGISKFAKCLVVSLMID